MNNIYLSGAISNQYNGNRLLFNKAKMWINKQSIFKGYKIIDPHDIYDDMKRELNREPDWWEIMKKDIDTLLKCNIILMLPQWQTSYGARIEHLIAQKYHLIIHYLTDNDINNI